MFTAYQYRVYPTYSQRQTFEKQLEACQTLYNQALAMRKEAYEQKGEPPTYNKQAGMLTQLRLCSGLLCTSILSKIRFAVSIKATKPSFAV